MQEAVATVVVAIHAHDEVIATVSVANDRVRQVITTISGPIMSGTDYAGGDSHHRGGYSFE